MEHLELETLRKELSDFQAWQVIKGYLGIEHNKDGAINEYIRHKINVMPYGDGLVEAFCKCERQVGVSYPSSSAGDNYCCFCGKRRW